MKKQSIMNDKRLKSIDIPSTDFNCGKVDSKLLPRLFN